MDLLIVRIGRRRHLVPPVQPVFPETPERPYSEGVNLKRARRVSFKRRLQSFPINAKWQPPLVPAEPPAHDTHFEKTKDATHRRLQRVLIPPEYPQDTPPTAPYPSYVPHFEKTQNRTHRALRRSPDPLLRPIKDPIGIGIGAPARHNPFDLNVLASRRHQKNAADRLIPAIATVVAPTPAVFPSFVPGPTFRSEFRRTLQRVYLNERAAPTISTAEGISFAGIPTAIRSRFYGRRLRAWPRLDEYPASPTTPAVIAALTPPIRAIPRPSPRPDITITSLILSTRSFAEQVAYRRPMQLIRKRQHRKAFELVPVVGAFSVAPPTAAVYPAYVPRPAIRSAHKRALQRLPQLDRFPITPINHGFARGLGFHRWASTKTLQQFPPLWEYPATPPRPAQAVTAFTRAILTYVARRFTKALRPPEFAVGIAQPAIAFTDVTGATLGTVYESDLVTFTDIPVSLTVSFALAGGGSPQYSLDGGDWTDVAGPISVVNNQTFQLRLTSSFKEFESRTIAVQFGDESEAWTVTTGAKSVSRLRTVSRTGVLKSTSPQAKRKSISPIRKYTSAD